MNIVLIHGGFLGGWCWGCVAQCLRSEGHQVFTPTLTGMGERKHLLSRDISLEVYKSDILNVLVYENLSEVVLVGHSFSGIVAASVALQEPHRIRRIVHLDTLLPAQGKSYVEVAGDDVRMWLEENARQSGKNWLVPVCFSSAEFGVAASDANWVDTRLTPLPLTPLQQAVSFDYPKSVPSAYISCTRPLLSTAHACQSRWAQEQGWPVAELKTGHLPMLSEPRLTTESICSMLRR